MADIRIEKKHNFDLETARQKAQTWLAQVKKQFDLDAEYEQGTHQDVVRINRSGVDGRAILDADKLVFEADLAWLAKPLKGRIQSAIQDGMDKYFS